MKIVITYKQQIISFFGSDGMDRKIRLLFYCYDTSDFLQQQIISLFGPIRWYTEVFICHKPM